VTRTGGKGERVRTLRTGVLVVGSGGAGMRAAIEAAKHGK